MSRHLMTSRWIRSGASLVLALLFLAGASFFTYKAFTGFAWDFSINWTGAWALRTGTPLYDPAAMQDLAVERIDSGMRKLFNGPFQSYISLPTAAMLMSPFTLLPYEQAQFAYRLCALMALVAGLSFMVFALPAEQRIHAGWTAALLLVFWPPAQTSIRLGQLDGPVVLCLGAALFCAARRRWVSCGSLIGCAALLKVSPGWLLLYGLMRRQWNMVAGGSLTLAGGVLLCSLPRDGADFWQFFNHILPGLGAGSLHLQNQSLGAVIGRIATNPTQWTFAHQAAVWQHISFMTCMAVTIVIAHMHRLQAFSMEELPAMILVALLAGSITWDHYYTWALIPFLWLSFPRHSGPAWRLPTIAGLYILPVVLTQTRLAQQGALVPGNALCLSALLLLFVSQVIQLYRNNPK